MVIPNYNRSSLIGLTIDNMLRQSHPPTEIIVVDDGSTDQSRDVIRSFGERVVLIEQTNQGPGAARNAGIAAASCEFIQFMDSDDLASLNKIEAQINALRESGADFAYCPWIRVCIQGDRLKFTGPVMQARELPGWKSMLEWQMGSWCLVFQNCLFRRNILQKAGQYRTDLMPSEDSEYLIRILLAGARPIHTPECLVLYRDHDFGQITKDGVSAQRHAEDRSRYLEVVADDVSACLDSFHHSTRFEIALDVWRHNRYCQARGWPEVSSESLFSELVRSVPPMFLSFADFGERVYRKLSCVQGPTPSSPGMCLSSPGSAEQGLVKEMGFNIE